MAIFYYDKFSSERGSRNFGDDINPFLLGELFDEKVIKSQDLCVLGIGTIINDQSIQAVASYKKKLIFSSGVGYGAISAPLDDSWEVVCTRGPKSAERLGVSPEKAVCDGAVLLSDFFEVIPESARNIPCTFIPHITSDWSTGQVLRKVMKDLGINYLVPDAPQEHFIDQVSRSKLVIAEAMHGAILADTMRVPWIPVYLHEHEHHAFKWEDWFLSINMDYFSKKIIPTIWNPPRKTFKRLVKTPYQSIKSRRVADQIATLMSSRREVLSNEQLHKERKLQLYEKIMYINGAYGSAPVR